MVVWDPPHRKSHRARKFLRQGSSCNDYEPPRKKCIANKMAKSQLRTNPQKQPLRHQSDHRQDGSDLVRRSGSKSLAFHHHRHAAARLHSGNQLLVWQPKQLAGVILARHDETRCRCRARRSRRAASDVPCGPRPRVAAKPHKYRAGGCSGSAPLPCPVA